MTAQRAVRSNAPLRRGLKRRDIICSRMVTLGTIQCPATKGFETSGCGTGVVVVWGYDPMPRYEGV